MRATFQMKVCRVHEAHDTPSQVNNQAPCYSIHYTSVMIYHRGASLSEQHMH